MRFECQLEGLTANWVEVEERWTRREIHDMAATSTPESLITWLQDKLTACNIETVDGGAITNPKELTADTIDAKVDVRLYDFLGTVLIQAAQELRTLGPLSGRLLSTK